MSTASRRRSERGQIERALRNVALGVSAARGPDIFKEIVRHLAQTLDVDFAFLGKLAEGAPRLQTLAVFHDGAIAENFEYDLAGTPCETVVGRTFRHVPSRLCERYPGDGMLARFGFESYAGYPLFDAQGEALGLIAVVHRAPLREGAVVEAVLRVFSVRAAAELERLRTREAALASEASYRAIFEASEDCIFVHDIDTGAIVDVNPKACRSYGYSYEEMLGLDVGVLSSGEPPYTLEQAARYMERAKAGEPQRVEWHRRNKDGSLHWDEVLMQRARIGGVDRILAFTRDITERKRSEAERARLEAQLRQAQKMEAIGHLTGGIAHDFNNILTGVLGYLVLAAERAERLGDATLARYLDRAQRSGQRARELIQQMLTFSRGQRGEPRPLALAPLVKEAVKLLGPSLPSSVEIETALDDGVPAVVLDPVQVEQVLVNLCINARDAMEGSGRIEVRLRLLETADAICASCRRSVSGRFVELAVRDTGAGVPAEIQDRIFEPFFSTKDVGKGSGMGLSTVHGIVHEHGGHVLLDTAPRDGSAFRVLFPPLDEGVHGEVGAGTGDATALAAGKGLYGRVLLVDDDDAAGSFMQDLFESWGLEVTYARGAADALRAFAAAGATFDLALLDQTMPRMTGLELAAALRKQAPSLPILLYSGYADDLDDAALARAGIHALVRKPVDPGELLPLVRELLGDARRPSAAM